MYKANTKAEVVVVKAQVKVLSTLLVFFVCRRVGGGPERRGAQDSEPAAASGWNNMGAFCWEDGSE